MADHVQDALEGMEHLDPSRRPKKRSEGEGGGRAPASGAQKVTYKKSVTAHPPKCEMCVAKMIEGGKWSAPNPAVYLRTDIDGTKMLICYPHAADMKATEGGKALRR